MNRKKKRYAAWLTAGVFIIVLTIASHSMAVDNMMINEEIKEIGLNRDPTIGMSFTPGVEPGVVISPPEGGSGVLPGYRVRHKGVGYLVGVSCSDDLADDCSAYPYSEDYQDRMVFIRYIQTADRMFESPEGSATGDRWDQTLKRVGSQQIHFSGNDSCIRLPSGWHACIDLMSTDRKFDPNVRRLMPRGRAKIEFYYKSPGSK